MNAQRAILLWPLVLALSAHPAPGHDKGDLMLNIEPQIGLVFPQIALHNETGVIKKAALGIEFAPRATVHYYFVDFFAVNAGFGLAGSASFFYNDYARHYVYNNVNHTSNYSEHRSFSALYFSIPTGVRFSVQKLAVGAGITANFPLLGKSDRWSYGGETRDDERRGKDYQYSLKPYAGWYFDIGFDRSGRKGFGSGFGMAARLSGALSNKIVSHPGYDKFWHFALHLVFYPSIQLASLPIGGKTQSSPADATASADTATASADTATASADAATASADAATASADAADDRSAPGEEGESD